MKAVILSAGQGQRLRPITNDRPKGMVSIGGRTIIERQLALFRASGIDDVAIVTGFCADAVPSYGVRHYLNPDYATTNMVCSLFCAAAEFGAEPVIVSYGDILYSPAVLEAVMHGSGAVVVAVDREWKSYFAQRFADPYDDAESLVIDEVGQIRSIGQPRPSPSDVQAQYIGLIKFDPAGLAAITAVRDSVAQNATPIGWGRPWRKAYMTDLLQELVNRGVDVRPALFASGWCEIDSPRDLALAEQIIGRFSDPVSNVAR